MFRPTSSLLTSMALLGLVACAQGSTDDGVGAGEGPDARPPGGGDFPDAAPGGNPDAPTSDSPDAAPLPPMADAAPAAPDAIPPDAAPPSMACMEAMNYAVNDVCADALDVTAGASMAGGVQVHGDTTGYAGDLEPDSTCTSGFGLDGPDAIYLIDATAGQTIDATLVTDAGTFDQGMYILPDCTVATTCLAGTDSTTGSGTETLSYTVATTGPHYLVVDSYLPSEFGCYSLQVTLQ